MKPLTPEIAQEIACEADKIINHGVLITDENGYVIGSSDPNRINTLHEASLLVMKRRKPAYLNAEACAKYAGTRPGVTFPVSLSGNIVGSVGITGQLEDVAQFGQLIRMFVEVFLKDHLNQEMDDLREQGHYDLLTEIVSYGAPNGAEEETILRHGQALGYDLTLQRVVFVVEALYLPGQTISEFRNYSRIIRRVFTDPQDFYVKITPDKFTVFSTWLITAKRNGNRMSFAREQTSCWIPCVYPDTTSISASAPRPTVWQAFARLILKHTRPFRSASCPGIHPGFSLSGRAIWNGLFTIFPKMYISPFSTTTSECLPSRKMGTT